MPNSGGEMKMKVPDGAEELEGFTLERLDTSDLQANERIIQELKFNPIDNKKSRGLEQKRESRASVLSPEYLRSGKHGELFLVKDAGNVVGFVALRIASGEHVGTIERILLAEGHHQANTLLRTLKSAEEEMRKRGCTEGVIRDENLSHDMELISTISAVTNFYTFAEKGDESNERVVLENGQ